MAEQQFPSREVKTQPVRGTQPEPGFEPGPAPPEASNRDHAEPVGSRAAVPGAGVVRESADAGPVESDPDRGEARRFPGHGTGPLDAPGAKRPGTTSSGVASPPDPATSTSNTAVTEEVTAGGEAPLSVPSDSVGPQPAAADVPEIADPNYTAASQARFAANPDRARRRDIGPNARVADVMSRDLDYCEPYTLVQYVARMMVDKDVGAIPVVDKVDTMKPVGIITDRDIVIRVVAKNQDAAALRADQCMSSNVLTIDESAPLNEAVLLMERQQIRRVPVVNRQGRLVGMLSQGDVAETAPREETGDLVRAVSEPGSQATQGEYH
ncbi:MAG TPA: CBS domain-containing protein [Tepidisphaeraceae bacterium]